jgi:hypothetical protein
MALALGSVGAARAPDHNRRPERSRSEDKRAIFDWDANAAVTCGPVRNDGGGVDRQAAMEIQRVWKPELKRLRPALQHPPDDGEVSDRRRREGSARDVDRASKRAPFDDEQHLAAEIDLERSSEWRPGFGRLRLPQRSACPWADKTVAADPLPALEGNHGVAGLVAEDAVDPAAGEIAERDESPLE